ncbi:hypothetical protein [Gloeothece verrucosa]|uniref:Uncharacterized protein n=1 Tax=Gloeothece verrucosa (strain PCC 7822) TaxID=497965 RepID=E0UJR1_GLOV7|nr:hypothetical protein [Gloeothece verrucosa]ADN13422.1 hypothetical protein Cyan7822_1424 [Gloeothece verrucosa PCC 7822]
MAQKKFFLGNLEKQLVFIAHQVRSFPFPTPHSLGAPAGTTEGRSTALVRAGPHS